MNDHLDSRWMTRVTVWNYMSMSLGSHTEIFNSLGLTMAVLALRSLCTVPERFLPTESNLIQFSPYILSVKLSH
jgi:hypothetical protein